MKHFSSLMRGWPAALLILLWLAGPAARAQAPAWQMALPISGAQSYINASAVDASGNIYVTGQFTGTAVFGSITLVSTGVGSDLFVAKWDRAGGSFVWAQRAGGSMSDIANAIAINGTSIYITGWFGSATASFGPVSLTNATPASTDLFVAKLTDTGAAATFAWARQLGSSGYEYGNAIAVSGTNVYVAGSFASPTLSIGSTTLTYSGPTSYFVANGFVCKLTDSGSTASFSWAQPCGSESEPSALAVAGAGVYVAGYFVGTIGLGSTTMTSTGRDVFVAKLLDQGSTSSYSWARPAGGPGNDQATGIAVSGTSVYLTGWFNNTASFGTTSLISAGSSDVFIAKLTDSGATTAFTWVLSARGNDIDEAYTVVVKSPYVYVGGAIGSSSASFGTTTLNHAINNYFSRDGFLTQLLDTGPSASFTWAKAIGGDAPDGLYAIAISGSSIFGAGYITPPATFDNISIPASAGRQIGFFASLTDPTLLATAAAQGALSFSLAPNPARAATTVLLPALPGAATATLTLRDALGRALHTETISLPAAGLRHELDLTGLPAGLYAVQVQAGAATATRRLVVE